MHEVIHVPASEGERVWGVGDTYTVKLEGSRTDQRLSLLEGSIPPGSGPPPHVHRNEDEAYYVLDGELEILDGERTFVAGPGSFVYIPRGTVHRFRNVGFGHARLLILFTPAGFERFFSEAGTPAQPGQPAPMPDEAELARTAELAPRFGLEVLAPA